MTQAGGNGNGHKDDSHLDDMTVYEPAYSPSDDTELVGWWKDADDEDEGEFVSELELDDDDDQPNGDSDQSDD